MVEEKGGHTLTLESLSIRLSAKICPYPVMFVQRSHKYLFKYM